MISALENLRSLVAATALRPAAPELAAAARHVAALHAPGVKAVLAYGSALRGENSAETLIDLYVLCDELTAVSPNRLSRLACRLIPPNVAYAETTHAGAGLRIKYAVLPFDLFCRKVGPATANPYFWARFAQPCRLVHAASDTARNEVLAALVTATTTFIAAARPLAERGGDDVLAIWREGFKATYRTELRSEQQDRAGLIVAADPDYYISAGRAALGLLGSPTPGSHAAQRAWASRRRRGKVLSVLRLLKAAFTFAAGADYLAWKISRHSGIEVKLKPWQRRHPILGALVLLPGLLRKGAVR